MENKWFTELELIEKFKNTKGVTDFVFEDNVADDINGIDFMLQWKYIKSFIYKNSETKIEFFIFPKWEITWMNNKKYATIKDAEEMVALIKENFKFLVEKKYTITFLIDNQTNGDFSFTDYSLETWKFMNTKYS